jgi:microsomal prostaglandin-E synthase 2
MAQSANEWVDAVGPQRFLGGNRPDNADLSMFGVIRSVTGTPTFHDLMHNTRIGPWYERMMGAVGDSARIN